MKLEYSFIKVTSVCLIIFIIEASYAGTSDKVKAWFEQQNYTNITNPGIYDAQSARYSTLGGISTRSAITQPFHLVDIQTPKFSAGCGGIDFYAGGFSAINADQFVQNLRAIGQNAQSLAFMLAIQIVSPQLSAVMQEIQTWANKYLNRNMSSCEAATQMVGGTMEYFGAKAGNCTVKRMQDFGEDWTKANYNCTTGGQIKSTENAPGNDINKVDFIKGNLAWFVLMQDPFFQNDLEFAELVMNLTGTMIIVDANSADDGPSNITIIEPAISDEVRKERYKNIHNALLNGNESKNNLMIYRCLSPTSDTNGCDKISSNLESIKPNWEGLNNRIQKIVREIVQKIYRDEPLNSEEKGVIASTTIPLYRFLTVTAAYFPQKTDISRSIGDYTKLIAEDILLHSLSAVIAEVEQQTSQMKNGMSESKRILYYKQNIQKVLSGIASLNKENRDLAERYLDIQQRIQMYEKALMSRLSSGIINSATWGNNR